MFEVKYLDSLMSLLDLFMCKENKKTSYICTVPKASVETEVRSQFISTLLQANPSREGEELVSLYLSRLTFQRTAQKNGEQEDSIRHRRLWLLQPSD